MTCPVCVQTSPRISLTCQQRMNCELALDSELNMEPTTVNSNTLLRANYHPETSYELSSIRRLLQTAESNLSNIDSDILHIQGILENLFTRREKIQDTVDLHKSFLAPIRRLPNELLSEIFLSRCTWIPPKRDSTRSTDSFVSGTRSVPFANLQNDSLWSILQVCHHWRQVAQSTSRLWNTLYIDLTPLKGKPAAYAHLLSRLNICLSHILSTALPLNFAVTGTHYSDASYLFPLISTLCSHADRWGKTYFCPYTTNILSSPKLEPKYRHLATPTLTSLGLTSFKPSAGLIQTSIQLSLTSHLHKLALHDYQPLSPFTTPPDPFLLSQFHTHLTHLYLDSCPYPTFSEILPSLISLTHLQIINKYQHSTRSLDIPTIPLPNLVYLKTTGWLGNLCFLLPRFVLPSIKHVHILALEEQCHPCTCGSVKLRLVNEWIDSLRSDTHVILDHASIYDLKTSTDEGIIQFLFADAD